MATQRDANFDNYRNYLIILIVFYLPYSTPTASPLRLTPRCRRIVRSGDLRHMSIRMDRFLLGYSQPRGSGLGRTATWITIEARGSWRSGCSNSTDCTRCTARAPFRPTCAVRIRPTTPPASTWCAPWIFFSRTREAERSTNTFRAHRHRSVRPIGAGVLTRGQTPRTRRPRQAGFIDPRNRAIQSTGNEE